MCTRRRIAPRKRSSGTADAPAACSSRVIPLFLTFSLCAAIGASGAEGQAQFGVAAGSEYGFGLTGRVGTPVVGLEVGGGVTPVLVLGTQQLSVNGSVVSDEVFFEAFFPAAVGAKVSLRISGSSESDGVSVEIGPTYNSLLKLGVGAGFDARVSERMVLSAGLNYFSEAGDRLGAEVSERRNFPLDRLDLGPLVDYQPYVGLSLLFF